jgi:hypothetical protein
VCGHWLVARGVVVRQRPGEDLGFGLGKAYQIGVGCRTLTWSIVNIVNIVYTILVIPS